MPFDSQIFQQNYIRMKNSIDRYAAAAFNRKGTPLMMSFLVTNRCFLKCKHCFYHRNQNTNPLAVDQYELTFDEYRKLSCSMESFLKAIFSGGEPFIREDLHEIVRLFQVNNKVLWCSSSTNGQATTQIVTQLEKIISRCKNYSFSLAFSLDGFREYHDEIRGKNTFDKALQTWKECQKLAAIYKNLSIYICTTLNSINKKIMPAFIRWCGSELHPDMISLLLVRQNPRDGEYLKKVSPEEYHLSRNAIEEEIRSGRMGNLNFPQTYINSSICTYVEKSIRENRRGFECYAGQNGGFIDYNGDVGVCEMMPPIGNLRDYEGDFLRLWNSNAGKSARQLAGRDFRCGSCTHETEGIIPSLFFGTNEVIPLWAVRGSII